ncbi:protein YLS7-like [Asparagus officinalis]|uniref:protein YLS7-like n=1 Tax=Asparagus officinalis TaxID=4686 RepID=UPI00098E0AF8|nr:protein YLS7-like [Asparagus officinalis]
MEELDSGGLFDKTYFLFLRTEVPVDHTKGHINKWHFRSTSTNIIRIWSQWLVHKTAHPFPVSTPRTLNVHIDTPHRNFIDFLPQFDVLVISSGHWFSTESTYRLNNTIVGGQLSPTKKSFKDVIEFYGVAVQTALNAILEASNYTGLTVLRSYSPEHYQRGEWNTGGKCTGIDKPARESVRSRNTNSMQKMQVVEFEKAARRRTSGSKLKFMDVTEMSGYRNDGHPGRYNRNVSKENAPEDCLHWCTPGVVDTWNEVLFEILKREF